MYRLITSTLKPSGLWGDNLGGLGDVILWEIHEACAARFAGGDLAPGEAALGSPAQTLPDGWPESVIKADVRALPRSPEAGRWRA